MFERMLKSAALSNLSVIELLWLSLTVAIKQIMKKQLEANFAPFMRVLMHAQASKLGTLCTLAAQTEQSNATEYLGRWD